MEEKEELQNKEKASATGGLRDVVLGDFRRKADEYENVDGDKEGASRYRSEAEKMDSMSDDEMLDYLNKNHSSYMDDVLSGTDAYQEYISRGKEGASAQPEPKSQREKYFALIKEEYPDDDFSDEENYFKRAIENNGKRKKDGEELTSLRGKNQELMDLLDENPELGLFLSEVHSGASVPYALGKIFDKETIFPDGGELEEEDYKRGKSERDARTKERKELAKRMEENVGKNAEMIKAFLGKRGLSDEQGEEFLGKAVQSLGGIKEGLIAPELLDFLYDGYNYDKDVELARKAGEIDGRNQKIALGRKSFENELPDSRPSAGKASDGDKGRDRFAEIVSRADATDVWKLGKQK
jgi:hypothetical protein